MADSCSSPPAVLYAFGPFEFDPQSGLLRRHGRRIDLSHQRQKILAMLLERPGELVTREEIRQRLWPPDTFVDFDNSLNVAVNRIRQVLRDSADQPLYIETHARLGYRFIAPVTVTRKVDPAEKNQPAAEDSAPAAAFPPRASRRPVPRPWLALLAALLALAAASAWFWWQLPSWPQVVSFRQVTYDRSLKTDASNLSPVLTDGGRIYFSENTSQGWQLMSAGLDAADPVPLHLALPSLRLQDLSPDGLRLLAVQPRDQGSQLWIVTEPGSQLRPIPNVHARAAAWSPQGRRIVFSWRHGLFLMHADGTGLQRLATLPSTPWWIRWSPTGNRLRFSLGAVDADTSRLWQFDLRRRTAQPLAALAGFHNACCGNWSAHGRYFFFQAQRHSPNQVYVWPRHAPAPRPLVASPFNLLAPAPLGGHRLLAVGQSVHAQVLRWSSRQARFRPFLGGLAADWVTYSPDHRYLAYIQISSALGQHNTWLARADGTHARQLTFPPWQCEGLAWSPHGHRLLIRERTAHRAWHIQLFSLATGHFQRLPDIGNAGIPTWAPDGVHLAYGDLPNPAGRFPPHSGIHLYNLRTARRHLLPGSVSLWTARWSPNGDWIAALQESSQQLTLYSPRSHSWHAIPITSVDNLTWTRDGRALVFDTSGTHAALYRLRIKRWQLRKIASLAGFGWLEDGWSGLSFDNQPLITRRFGLSEIYRLRWRATRWPGPLPLP